uniref:Uncharacterized protein n=1 Tax=viral metagenome TaxID=1070528 RepID=A0A6M3LZ61_9ZZZZ
MRRAAFTIRLKNGSSYDANHLAITVQQFFGDDGMMLGAVSMLSFSASGEQRSVYATDVESVTFDAVGVDHCSECDSPLDMIGYGVHETLKPTGGG